MLLETELIEFGAYQDLSSLDAGNGRSDYNASSLMRSCVYS